MVPGVWAAPGAWNAVGVPLGGVHTYPTTAAEADTGRQWVGAGGDPRSPSTSECHQRNEHNSTAEFRECGGRGAPPQKTLPCVAHGMTPILSPVNSSILGGALTFPSGRFLCIFSRGLCPVDVLICDSVNLAALV